MTRIPFNPEDVIEYCGERAIVVSDDGGSRIRVIVDDIFQNWYFEFEGEQCKPVESKNL